MKKPTTDILLEVVKNSGLDESEARVYLAALAIGRDTIHQLAKQANLNRTSSYGVIDRLKAKGLVSVVKKGEVSLVSAVAPDKLLQVQKDNYQNLERHLADLNYLFTIAKKDPGVKFYEGSDGLKTVLEMIVAEAKEVAIFGDGEAFKKAVPGWSESYSHKRIKSSINSRLLLKGDSQAIDAAKKVRTSKDAKSRLTQIRVLPEGYGMVGGFDVFNDKVVLYSFDENCVAVVIESQIISAMMLAVFNILWNLAENYDRTLVR